MAQSKQGLIVKYWKGFLQKGIEKSFEWEITMFKSEVLNTKLVVFEIPNNNTELIADIERFLQTKLGKHES